MIQIHYFDLLHILIATSSIRPFFLLEKSLPYFSRFTSSRLCFAVNPVQEGRDFGEGSGLVEVGTSGPSAHHTDGKRSQLPIER